MKQSPSKERTEWDSSCKSETSAHLLYKHSRMPREALHSNSWNIKNLWQGAWTFKMYVQSLLLKKVLFLTNKLSWKSSFYHMCTLNRKQYVITPLWNKVQKPPRETRFALQLHSNLKLITGNVSYSYQTSRIWRFTQTKLYCFRT